MSLKDYFYSLQIVWSKQPNLLLYHLYVVTTIVECNYLFNLSILQKVIQSLNICTRWNITIIYKRSHSQCFGASFTSIWCVCEAIAIYIIWVEENIILFFAIDFCINLICNLLALSSFLTITFRLHSQNLFIECFTDESLSTIKFHLMNREWICFICAFCWICAPITYCYSL